jgi:hypothetical protein
MSRTKEIQTRASPQTGNAFCGKTEQPTPDELAAALGKAQPVWDQLVSELEQELGANVREWKCYSPKAGWSLRMKRKARTIVWLGPREGAFIVAFILGDRALQAARATRLPQKFANAIETAPKYPEGTGVRILVKSPKDLPALMALAGIKTAN